MNSLTVGIDRRILASRVRKGAIPVLTRPVASVTKKPEDEQPSLLGDNPELVSEEEEPDYTKQLSLRKASRPLPHPVVDEQTLGRRLLQKTIATGRLTTPSRLRNEVAVRLAQSTFPAQALTRIPLPLLRFAEALVLPNLPPAQQLLHGKRPRTAINRTNRDPLSDRPSRLTIPRHVDVLSIQLLLTRLRHPNVGLSLTAWKHPKLNPPQPEL